HFVIVERHRIHNHDTKLAPQAGYFLVHFVLIVRPYVLSHRLPAESRRALRQKLVPQFRQDHLNRPHSPKGFPVGAAWSIVFSKLLLPLWSVLFLFLDSDPLQRISVRRRKR